MFAIRSKSRICTQNVGQMKAKTANDKEESEGRPADKHSARVAAFLPFLSSSFVGSSLSLASFASTAKLGSSLEPKPGQTHAIRNIALPVFLRVLE